MNRKKAIFSIFLIGGGAAASYSGYTWFSLHKSPDLSFLDSHRELIGSLADTIIPRTNTPGAKDAMVHDFIIAFVKKGSDRKTQNRFIDGLKQVKAYADSEYGQAFEQLPAQLQINTLDHFRKKTSSYGGKIEKVRNRILGKSFYTILKEYTTIGYCTSKLGATQGLSYDFIPGSYTGCIPMTEGQKAWATK